MLSRRSLLGSSMALAVGGAQQVHAQTATERTADLWAGLALVDSEGQAFHLDDIRQPLKLVKLWASWCPACLGEMEAISALAKALGPANLQVLLISGPNYWQRDQIAAQRLKLPFRLATLASANSAGTVDAAFRDQTGTIAVPRSLLFTGRANSLVFQQTGSTDWAAKAGQVRKYLA